jgi:PAS domain S-box-containing protein
MSLVVRIVAPTGRDAELIEGVLKESGIHAEICVDLAPFTRVANGEVGPFVIAEEALSSIFIEQLRELIQKQPEWSDLPILILTGGGRESRQKNHVDYERLSIGSPVLLERPIRTAILVSSVRAALRARQRQYEIRDTLRDRDRAFVELKQERETLQVVLDNLPVGVLLAKSNGKVILGNHSIERILRHPAIQTLESRDMLQTSAFHPDGHRLQYEEYPLIRAISSGQPIPPEDFLYLRGDGSLGWINISAAPILNEQGAVTGGVVAVSDIDHQKRTDFRLNRSDERFRRLIEHSTVGLLIGDFEGHVSYANPAILNLLGYTAEEVAAGALAWDLITPAEHAAADRKAMQELRSGGTAESYQKTFRAKDGRLVPFLIGATVIPSQRNGGSAHEIAVFAADLSSQKQAESALIQSEKLAAVGRLAASISHEINNPLESVTNLLYLARLNEETPPSVQSFLKTAEQELQRVSQISAQTLRFHRQSTKPTRITPEELLEPTLALYNGRLLNSHIQLVVEHRGAGYITCYEGDMRQVLNNLISNAIDSMRAGGRLIVRTAESWIKDETTRGVRITVADTGHGMSQSVIKRICEPFYTTKGINGTGLGLWISRGIIEKHRGSLKVRSRTGEACSGSVFSLFLPAQPF